MSNGNNEFVIKLLALLDKQKSKSQINSDINNLEQTIRKIKIVATLSKGNTKTELNQTIRQMEAQLRQIKVQAKIDNRQLNREINNALRNVSARDINLNLNSNGERLNAQVRRVVSQAREYVNRNPLNINIDLKKEKLLNQLAAFTNKYTKINESSYWLGEAERLRGVISSVTNRDELRNATDQLQVFTSGVRATGYATVSTTDRIKGMLGNIVKVGNYFGLAFVAVNKFRQSLNTLKTNDTILTEISKTSEMTKKQLQELGDEAFKVASKYGQVSGNYLTAVQEMARSGYEALSNELGELSLLAQSAGNMTSEMANNYLLATDAAYKYGGSVEKLNAALDGANYVSNKNSASLTDIADATRVSASFAANAGVAVDELTAAEATMIATTKRSGSEMGRAFRSIILNLQQVSGEFDGEVIDEESLKKVEERCHSLGVELEYMKDGVATLRNPMEILKELSEVYNSLPDNSADKQGLISDIGGKYHANALSALLSRWDMYEKMLGEFSQGTGSALEEANKTADSWEGRLAQLQNTWDSFINSLIDKNTVKGGISFLDNTIQAFEKLTDTLGAIPTILATVNTSMTALNKNYGITQLFNRETHKMDIQGNFMGIDITAFKAQKKHFGEAETAIASWNSKLLQGVTDINNFNNATVQNNEQLKAYLATTSQEAPASLNGYKSYLHAAGVSTDSLRLKTILLNSVISLGLGLAIQAVVTGITKLIQAENELAQKTQEAAKAYDSSSKTIADYTEKYQELQKALLAAKGNEQETYNVKKQLLDLQTELNATYGDEYGKINLVTDAYKDQTAALQNYNKELSNSFLNENEKGIKQAKRKMEYKDHYNLSYTGISEFSEEGKILQELAEKYEKAGVKLQRDTDGLFSIHLDANAEDAYDIIDSFMSDLRRKSEKFKDENLFSETFNLLSSELNRANDTIEKFGDNYKKALIAEINTNDSLLKTYNDAIKKVEEYNEAVLKSENLYDDKNVENAYQNLQKIKTYIQDNESEWGSYSSVIKDVFGQADTSCLDFSHAISTNQDGMKDLISELKNFNSVELQSMFDDGHNEDAFDKLIDKAAEYDICVEHTSDEVQKLIDLLVQLGYVQGEAQGEMDNEIDLETAKSNITSLTEEYELLQEVLSDTGNIQQETYEKFISCSSKYATAIKTENGRITVNTTKLKQVAKSRQLDTKEAIRQTLALKKQEWIQWKNRIENYNGTLLDSIEIKYGDIDALQAEITQYELLVNSLDNASSAFERFKAAQQTDDQDMYDTAKDAFDLVNDTLNDPKSENFAKFNTDNYQEAISLIASDESYQKLLNAENLDEYVKLSREVVKTLKPLFDGNGNEVDELFKRADAIIDSGEIPKNDKEWADRLETSIEGFQALKQYSNLFEYNGGEYFSSSFTDRLDEYQSLLSNAAQAQETLNAVTDKSSHEYMQQGKALEEAQGKLDSFVNMTTDSMTKAYDKYVIPGNASGQTFAEYIKAQFDYEDTDIDGSILAMIDKADTLKQRLDSISTTEAVQKQFSEYDQLQSIISVLSALGVQYEKTVDNKANFEAAIQTKDKKSSSDTLKNQIEQYKELQKEAETCQRVLSNTDPKSEAFSAMSMQLTELKSQMDALREPITIEINANIAELEARIQRVTEAKNQFAKSNSGLENTMFYSSQMNSYNAQLEKDTANKADLEKTLKVIVEDDEAKGKMEALASFQIEDKTFSVSVNDNATPVIDAINSKMIADKNFKITGSYVGTGGGSSTPTLGGIPVAEADGTVSSFAGGTPSNISIQKNEKALVNELGEEGLVRNGKLIPIKGGAQFLNLRRGDIIFNHKQMEQLKKNGYTAGRGKLISSAHVNGTVDAFVDGTKTYTTYNKDKVLQDWTYSPANPKNRKAEKKAAEEKEKEEKEANEEIFDWIERRIKRLQAAFDKWLKQAETALTSGFITKYYKKAANAMSQLLNTQGKAYNRYMQEANAVGLDETYAKKVRAGEIDIQTIKDEELADKISKYQEWYDKATDSTTSFMETAEKLYNLPLDKAATKIEKFSDAIDLLNKKIDNAIGSKSKNKLVDKQTKEEKKTLEAYKTASKEAAKNLKTAKSTLGKSSTLKNSGVTAKEKKAIQAALKAGKEISLSYFKVGSTGYNAAVKYNEALKANTQATYDLATAQEEYNSWLVEASKIKFDNIADDYEKKVQMLDHQVKAIDNRISEIETAGKNTNRSYYDTQKEIMAKKLAEYKQEKAALEESLKGIKQGTDEWYDAFDAIQQVSDSISDCVKETYNLNNAINQLHFDLFDDVADSIDRIITEQEFLQGLFAHEKNADDETGNLTEAGIAKLGSLAASYYASKEKAANDKEMVDKLQSMLNNEQLSGFGLTFNSVDDLEAKLQEMYTTWQNDIKETYSLESNLADVMKEKYQAELDLLKEQIDRKKEALSAEKDLHDYQKSINEKTDNIATIQKQIAAYSGDSSQEGLAKLQKLQKKLSDKQEDLAETEYDRYISDQQDMLDKLYEEYEELITKKLEDFMGLVQEGLKTANNNLSGINAYLSQVATDNGYTEETKGLFNGVTGGIKENADRIISAIEKKAEADSGTKSDGQGDLVADTAKPPQSTVTNANGSKGNTESSANAIAASDADKTKNAYAEQIGLQLEAEKAKAEAEAKKSNSTKQSTGSNKYVIVGQTKVSTISDEGRATISRVDKSETDSIFSILKSDNIWKNLMGFRKGGIARLIKGKGEDGITLARNGEGFIAPEHVKPIMELVDSVPILNGITQNLVELPKLPDIEPVRNVGNNTKVGSIYCNFELPNVVDEKSFIKTMQNSKAVQKCMRNLTIENLENVKQLSHKNIL
ncbi:MAG: phage tail tape measure protein [Roseburia sp.]|nr:phage tail tape measure protein [Roseburia sp.]MCM1278489.1 phage tail tape measure protein [Robinsoniella sp.]